MKTHNLKVNRRLLWLVFWALSLAAAALFHPVLSVGTAAPDGQPAASVAISSIDFTYDSGGYVDHITIRFADDAATLREYVGLYPPPPSPTPTPTDTPTPAPAAEIEPTAEVWPCVLTVTALTLNIRETPWGERLDSVHVNDLLAADAWAFDGDGAKWWRVYGTAETPIGYVHSDYVTVGENANCDHVQRVIP